MNNFQFEDDFRDQLTFDDAKESATTLHKFCDDALRLLPRLILTYANHAEQRDAVMQVYVSYSNLKTAIGALAPSLKQS